MKICLVNPTVIMKRPVAEISAKLKHDVTILCPKRLGKNRDKSMHYSDKVSANMIVYNTIQLPISSEWPIPLPSFLWKTIKMYRENDVIHMWVYFYLSSLWICFLKIFFPRKKLILTVDTIPGESFSAGKTMDLLFKTYHKLFGRIIFGKPDVITLYGNSLIPYAKKLGIDENKIAVILTGIDSESRKKRTDIRKNIGVGKDETFVLFVGLLLDRKGIDTLLRTIKDINVKAVIVGDGPQRRKYERMAEQLGIRDKVIFTGFRKDVEDFYRSADIFFFPSRGEGLAGVIMEAMAAGLPIVSSKIPCTTDLVADGKNGYLCEIEDTDSYRKRITQLASDKELRQKMGRQSKDMIKNFKWETTTRRFQEIYT